MTCSALCDGLQFGHILKDYCEHNNYFELKAIIGVLENIYSICGAVDPIWGSLWEVVGLG